MTKENYSPRFKYERLSENESAVDADSLISILLNTVKQFENKDLCELFKVFLINIVSKPFLFESGVKAKNIGITNAELNAGLCSSREFESKNLEVFLDYHVQSKAKEFSFSDLNLTPQQEEGFKLIYIKYILGCPYTAFALYCREHWNNVKEKNNKINLLDIKYLCDNLAKILKGFKWEEFEKNDLKVLESKINSLKELSPDFVLQAPKNIKELMIKNRCVIM